LSVTYSTGHIGKHLSDAFLNHNSLKQDALSPTLFNFTLGNTTKEVQENEDEWN
jgi:hypothetical protein